tara:strand:- start:61 stop:453 length:393 start_codon:yes stop_codon:yes gene_type:complete
MPRQRVGTFLRFSNGEPGTILPGHVVAISKSADDTVVLAQATDLDRMPAIGFAKRVTASAVVVQTDAVFKWPSATDPDISAGSEYWVGTGAGLITDDPTTIPSGAVQIVGIGKKEPRHIVVRMSPEVIFL